MCNEDKCNDGKEKATNENIVESEMTFEDASMKMAMGRMNKIYPGSVNDIVEEPGVIPEKPEKPEKPGSTGSSESPRCSGIKNRKQIFFMKLIIFKN